MKKTICLVVVALFLLTATVSSLAATSSFTTTEENLSPYASAEYSGTRTYRFFTTNACAVKRNGQWWVNIADLNTHIEYYVKETQQTYGVKKQYVQAVSDTGVQLSDREVHDEGGYTLRTIYGIEDIDDGFVQQFNEVHLKILNYYYVVNGDSNSTYRLCCEGNIAGVVAYIEEIIN